MQVIEGRAGCKGRVERKYVEYVQDTQYDEIFDTHAVMLCHISSSSSASRSSSGKLPTVTFFGRTKTACNALHEKYRFPSTLGFPRQFACRQSSDSFGEQEQADSRPIPFANRLI